MPRTVSRWRRGTSPGTVYGMYWSPGAWKGSTSCRASLRPPRGRTIPFWEGGVGRSPAAGVTVLLRGAASKTATTDASGNYTFTNVGNGSYTVTPSKAAYTFTPVNRS